MKYAPKSQSVRHMISDICISKTIAYHDGLVGERVRQQASYASGKAYQGHVRSAHKGVEDPNCRACKELRMKCNITSA
jgi:hypothetical protein